MTTQPTPIGPSLGHRKDAKHPSTVAAGPYGHPFHPILVTVPIGAWVAAFVFDLVSRAAGEAAVFAKGAFWLVIIGLAGAVVAALFGLLDLLTIPTDTKAFRIGLIHLALNVAVLALLAVSLALRSGHLDDVDGTPVGAIILTAIGLAVLGVSGWLGGMLSYHFGVRVAFETTQEEGFRRLHPDHRDDTALDQ